MLLVESEVQLLYAMNEARPFHIREVIAQPDNSLKPQDMPNADERPVRYAFLRFSDQICKEAYETPPDGAGCVVHQLTRHLGIPRAKLEDIIEQSVQDRYSEDVDSNPYWDEFSREIVDWQTDGVTAETIVDVARRLNVPCKILDCDGRTVLDFPGQAHKLD